MGPADEALLYLLLEQLDELAALVDEGDRFTRTSASLARTLHRTTRSLEAISFPETLARTERSRGAEFLAQVRETKSDDVGPVTLKHGPPPVEVSWRGFNAGDDRVVIVGSVVVPGDQERLRRMAQVGTMTAKLRHDLNNPLTAIMGLAELTLIQDKKMGPDSVARLHAVMENCNRIGELLGQIRDIREGRPLRPGLPASGSPDEASASSDGVPGPSREAPGPTDAPTKNVS